MTTIYNENDRRTAAWLTELASRGLVAPGVVNTTSITDMEPDDIRHANQVHLFAGIGGWSFALRLAGWPDDEPVWTGSCPCQPFSTAGSRRGTADERHLWPHMLRLLSECRPSVCFGEQVASSDGRGWLAGVRADMEALGYRFAAADLCAACVASPHIRQRLYWVAYAEGAEQSWRQSEAGQSRVDCRCSDAVGLAYATSGGPCGREPHGDGEQPSVPRSDITGLPDADEPRSPRRRLLLGSEPAERNPWARDTQVIGFTDGATRRIGAGIAPLAHGLPARVVRLRGYGNAIVPQLAARFIRASIEAINMT